MKYILFHIIVIVLVNQSFSDECSNLNDLTDSVKNIDKNCLAQLKKLCQRNDLLFSFWDSSSRQLHSGLLATNDQDLGNYDQCISIDEIDIKGKYCPYQWVTQISRNSLEGAIAIIEKNNHIPPKTKIQLQNDIYGDTVRFGVKPDVNLTLIGSICIPDACTPEEFTAVFNPYLYPVSYSRINAEKNCVTRESPWKMSTFDIVVTICICMVFLLVIVCTIVHVLVQRNSGKPHDLIKAFSVLHNGEKLITISRSNPEQIQCLHGLRFLCMVWVIAGHTFSTTEVLPHFNQKDVSEWRSHLYSQYILAGPYAVDTFFFISGMLLAYGYMKQMKEVEPSKQVKAIPLMILHRYLRLTPAVAALFFFSISTVKPLGNGPLWVKMTDMINQPCRDYWWRYFLYIQNYSKEICYTQTWYLSADMQMFILAPIVLIPSALYFRRRLRWVLYGISTLIVLITGITIGITYLVDDYDYPYDTHSRFSDYLVGIMGGIVLHTFRGKAVKMKKIYRLIVWIIVPIVMLFLILYLNDIIVNPTKDKTNLFYPIQRPIWCACILWIVFACHHGYGGIVDKFLSVSFFQIGSRLSYCMYCVHATVIMYFIGTVRTYQFFNDYLLINILFGNIVVIFIVSTIWTLCFESPMIIINKMLLGRLGSPKK